MEHGYCIRSDRKGKHLTREERIVIERLSRAGTPACGIARVLGRHRRTVERELARGRVRHLDGELRERLVYSSDRGQDVHDLNATAKGPALKLGRNRALAEFVRVRVVEHRESPDVVAGRMALAGMEGAVCTKTLYSYIDRGFIPGVGNESLWEKRKLARRRRRASRRVVKRLSKGACIGVRPPEADGRSEFGHWEMDLVVGPAGGSPAALLTLVERRHRVLIVRKLPDRTQSSVMRALRSIERQHGPARFRLIFKSVTVDNGPEFMDFEALEASAFSRRQRTRLFYAHPYASWERGSNENANRMLRRFVAKGRDISSLSKTSLRAIEAWINAYPRRIIGFRTPAELFERELKAIA